MGVGVDQRTLSGRAECCHIRGEVWVGNDRTRVRASSVLTISVSTTRG